MGFDLRLTAMAFIGLWSLVVGVKTCASSSESMSDAETASLCKGLLEGEAQQVCGDGDPFLEQIYDICIQELNETDIYGEGIVDDDDDDYDAEEDEEDEDEDDLDDDAYEDVISIYGGYEAQCDLPSSSPFLSRSVELIGEPDEHLARWVLNPKVVDITKKVTVQFRYTSDIEAFAKVLSGSSTGSGYSSELELDLPATAENGTYCTSEAISDFLPVKTTDDDGAIIYVIEARTFAFTDNNALLEGLVLAYEPTATADPNAIANKNYGCSGGRSALATCDPTLTDSEDCVCVDDDGNVRNMYNEVDLVTIIPLSILAFAVLMFTGIAYKYRSSKTVEGRDSCCHRKSCWRNGDGADGQQGSSGFKKRTGKIKSLHVECPEQGEDTHHVQLSDILADPTERKHFIGYLERNDKVEPMLLFESIETFEACEDRLWRQREARNMIARFIAPHAPYSVELAQSTRSALCGAKGAPKNLFEAAKAEVYAYMQINFMENFLTARNSGSFTPRRQSPRSRDSFDITTSDSVPAVVLSVDADNASPHTPGAPTAHDDSSSNAADADDDQGLVTQQLGVV